MRNILFFLTIFSAVALIGCGVQLPDDMPPLHPAQITFTTDDGRKVDGAIITLSLVGSGRGESVAGTTDENGVVQLYTRGEYAGAPVGKYKVMVSWTVGEEREPPPPGTERRARYDEARAQPGWEPMITYHRVLEPEYYEADKTPLEIDVVEGRNSFSFEVNLLPGGKALIERLGK